MSIFPISPSSGPDYFSLLGPEKGKKLSSLILALEKQKTEIDMQKTREIMGEIQKISDCDANPIIFKIFTNATKISKEIESSYRKEVEEVLQAASDGINPLNLIMKYKITDPNDLFEIAKKSAAVDDEFSQYIQNYGITDQDHLFELAKIATFFDQFNGVFSKNIQKYGIIDENHLFQLAKIGAESNSNFYKYIQNYAITNQDYLFELAKVSANKLPFSQYIQNLGITNQDYLFELAKIAITHDLAFSNYIQNYGITNEERRFELGKIAAAQNCDFSKHIKNFGITNQGYLFELGKIATRHDSDFLKYIQNFGITEQDYLFELGKIAATFYRELSKHIQNYGITNEERRFELAEIAVDRDRDFSKYIQNYGITNEERRFKLAKINAAKNRTFSQEIQNFGITNQDDLFKLAKIAVAHDPDFSKHIQKYGIANEERRFELAEIAVAHDPDFSKHIQNYGITNQDDLFKLAEIAVAREYDFSKHIQNYGIIKQDDLLKLAKIAARRFPLYFLKEKENYKINDKDLRKEFNNLVCDVLESSLTNETLDSIITLTEEWADVPDFLSERGLSLYPGFRKVSEWLDKETNPQIKSLLRNSIQLTCCLAQLMGVKNEQLDLFFEPLYELKNPLLRLKAAVSIVKALSDENTFNRFQVLSAGSPTQQRFKIPLLLFSFLVKEDSFYPGIRRILNHKNSKDNARLNSFILCLAKVTINTDLSSKQKEFFVNNILFEKEIILTPKELSKRAFIISSAFDFGVVKQCSFEELSDALEAKVISIFDLKTIENFREKFVEFLSSFRSPESIFTYAGGLLSLPEDEKKSCISLLGKYFQGVLDKSFPSIRYDQKSSPHLEKIFSDNHELERSWKVGTTYPLSRFLEEEGTKVETVINYRELITNCLEGIPQDKIPHSKIPNFMAALDGKTFQEIPMRSDLKKIESIDDLLLLLASPNRSKEDVTKIITNILNHFKREDWELLQDFKSLLSSLSSPPSQGTKYEKWKILDTDDASTLLHIGSDVSESCQKIDGSSNYNKCLLAYLMDGKNRALCIVNDKGITQARVILRLLWDEKEQKPILFKEKLYSISTCEDSIKHALEMACLERAEELNLPLLSQDGEGSPYPNRIVSLGSVAPFEYVDAGGLMLTNGRWCLDNSKKINL